MVREYNTPIIPENDDIDIEDIIYSIGNKTLKELREEYYYHCDDSCCYGKETNGAIYYNSKTDLFNDDILDATHLIIFLK